MCARALLRLLEKLPKGVKFSLFEIRRWPQGLSLLYYYPRWRRLHVCKSEGIPLYSSTATENLMGFMINTLQ
uniref:Uncharacterized protein n=1 Tax=Trichuris muris TaxID=70415 RepID=A0A5S6Q8R5_TRIMR